MRQQLPNTQRAVSVVDTQGKAQLVVLQNTGPVDVWFDLAEDGLNQNDNAGNPSSGIVLVPNSDPKIFPSMVGKIYARPIAPLAQVDTWILPIGCS